MPIKVDEEHLLVGAMILDEAARIDAYQRGINEFVIQQPPLQQIVSVLKEMDEAGFPVDVVVLSSRLKTKGHAISVEYLTELQSALMPGGAGKVSNAHHYAEMVLENYRSVQAWNAALEVIEAVRTDPDVDVQMELTRALKLMQRETQTPRGGWYAEVIPRYLDHLEEKWAGKGEKEYISTGHRDLDKLLRGGFYNGEFIVVGARPGMGKSVIGLDFIHAAARQGKRVAFFSAEMSTRAMLRRAASEFTGIPAFIADHPGPLVDHQAKMRENYVRMVAQDLSQLQVYVDDKSNPTVQYMEDSIERLGNIGMIVVDYLTLMGETGDMVKRMDQITLGLQRMSKDFNVPVIALAQLSRAVEAPNNKPYRPSMSHLRESGQIEANAHVVMLLYRARYYMNQGMIDDDGTDADVMSVMVAKHRDGDTGSVRLRFDGPTFSLKDFD